MVGKGFTVVLLLVFLLFCISTVLTVADIEYYPTDLGNMWVLETADNTERMTYTTEATEERINGTEIVLLKRVAETLGSDDTTGEELFVHFDEDGVKLHKIVAELGSVFGVATSELSSPVLFFPASLKIGDSWSVTVETIVKLAGPVSFTSIYEVIATEDVKTPAGTFENSLKIQVDSISSSTLGVTRTTAYQWMAPNVGIVKFITDQEIVFNLVSSNLLTDVSPYDVTGDGVVNILDLVFVASRFGSMDVDADVNADDVVDILDLVLVSQNFGN